MNKKFLFALTLTPLASYASQEADSKSKKDSFSRPILWAKTSYNNRNSVVYLHSAGSKHRPFPASFGHYVEHTHNQSDKSGAIFTIESENRVKVISSRVVNNPTDSSDLLSELLPKTAKAHAGAFRQIEKSDKTRWDALWSLSYHLGFLDSVCNDAKKTYISQITDDVYSLFEDTETTSASDKAGNESAAT